MRRRTLMLVGLVGVLVVVTGCGGGGSAGGGNGGDGEAGTVVDPATAATISGAVSFTGTPPENEPIAMDAEPTCAEQYPDGAFAETVLVSGGGELQNVFVYVKSGLESYNFPPPDEAVVLDQHGCRYVPHVLGVQAGQDLIIRNSDGLLHNIHPQPTTNEGFNLGQPVNMDTTRQFDEPEVMIPVKCDVHDWMTGYIGVLNHPYFAVTGADGSFSLPNLPPGAYTVEAWHEEFGTQTMEVTVGASETSEIEFTFTGG